MPSQKEESQTSFLLSDFNTRLKDIEERNSLIKDRVLLLGKNLITIKEDIYEELTELRKQTNQTQRDLEKLKEISNTLVSETNKFARKDEMILIEKMLKDFQPLEFMRRKDVEELIEQKLKPKKIKTPKTNKNNGNS